MSDFPREELEQMWGMLERHGFLPLQQPREIAECLREAVRQYDLLSDRLVMDAAAHRVEMGQKNQRIAELVADNDRLNDLLR